MGAKATAPDCHKSREPAAGPLVVSGENVTIYCQQCRQDVEVYVWDGVVRLAPHRLEDTDG